jgi:hypothetical protein
VDAFPKNDEIERQTGYGKRRHFIRQDIFFIVRTDYFDRNSRFFKSLTRHDLKQMDKKMWRANMVLMNNLKGNHRTLIKTEQRIFSHDYVPPEIFTWHWLFENRHLQRTKTLVSREALKTSSENGEIKNNMGN